MAIRVHRPEGDKPRRAREAETCGLAGRVNPSELLGGLALLPATPLDQRLSGLRYSHRFATTTKGIVSTRILAKSQMASFGYPSQRSP